MAGWNAALCLPAPAYYLSYTNPVVISNHDHNESRYTVRKPHLPDGPVVPAQARADPPADKMRDSSLDEPPGEDDHRGEDWMTVEHHCPENHT